MENMMKRIICLLMCLLMAAAGLPAAAEGAETAALPAEGAETADQPEEAAETADQPEAAAETADQPAEGEEAADQRVESFLSAQAAAQKDAWTKAILEAGAREIQWEGNTASFFLRSFDPDLKTLGGYAKAEDQQTWRTRALQNIGAYNLAVSLTFEEDGSVSKKQANALIKKVKNAARSAKGAFGKKDLNQAFTDLLFQVPKTGKTPAAAELMAPDPEFTAFIQARPELFPCESPSEWAPLMYPQRNWKFSSGKGGPHSITLSWDTLSPTALLNRALDSVSAQLAGVTAAQRPKEENLSYMWRSGLAETAVAAKKGRLQTQKIVIDVDDLVAGNTPGAYRDYYAAYQPAAWYEKLVEGYRQLPAEASQPMPKTGILSSVQKKGRGVFVKVPKGGRNTYVILRDADTGVIQAEAFIEPGKNVTMKVAEGVYIVQYATGSTWYGTEGAFGPLGTYSASDEFIVAKKKWKLVSETDQPGITLHPVELKDLGAIEDKSVQIEGVQAPTIELKASYPENHPIQEGISPYTGLAASGEPVTPIAMVLDNAEEAYPHWGVRYADIIFQVPNAGSGVTKLMALFGNEYPAQAGPVRSGRSSMLPTALMFDGALVFAGPPAYQNGGMIDLQVQANSFRMSQNHKYYNLLNNNGFQERVKGLIRSHDMSCHVNEIHENMVSQQAPVEVRPFLFTDEERTEGATANIVRVLHRGDDPKGPSNSASRAVFKYNAQMKAYTRTNSSGVYTDRDTGEVIPFANVIILRGKFGYEKNYIFFMQHFAGSGTAEIFQNGKYVRGAWIRNSADSRLILVDADGEELKLQRGKSFIVMTNDVTNVIYSE